MKKTVRIEDLDRAFKTHLDDMIYSAEHGLTYCLDSEFEQIKGFMWGLKYAQFYKGDEFGMIQESVDNAYFRLRELARENRCNKN